MGDTQSLALGVTAFVGGLSVGVGLASPPGKHLFSPFFFAKRLPMLGAAARGGAGGGGGTSVGQMLAFGPVDVGADKVFYAPLSKTSVAYGNLSAVVPGHLVVAPVRSAARVSDLRAHEWLDLLVVARTAQQLLKGGGANGTTPTAFNLCLKDGPAAGQPVPQVHLHVVPRAVGDLPPDSVYGLLDLWHPVDGEVNTPPLIEFPDDATRAPRTEESMAAEAARYVEAVAAAGTESGPLPGAGEARLFGPHPLRASQFFFASPSGLSLAMVNLKPLMPGHTLVISKRVAPTLADLSDEELADLWHTTRQVQDVIRTFYGATGVTLGIQDGSDAGQSVPHVHVHILPIGITHPPSRL